MTSICCERLGIVWIIFVSQKSSSMFEARQSKVANQVSHRSYATARRMNKTNLSMRRLRLSQG